MIAIVPQSRREHTLVGILGGLGLLAIVGYADFATGYQVTLLVFYLVPILFVLRYAGLYFSLAMALLAALVWLAADLESGQRYADYLTPIWNTGICLAVFLLVIVLVYARQLLQQLVALRTKSLQQEIQERARLEQELLAIADSEQRRIGHDLHDSLGQHLTATALAGKLLAKKIANRAPVEPAEANRIVNLVEEAIALTRNLARTLHPIALGQEGLAEALEHLAQSLSRNFNVSCQFQSSGDTTLNDSAAGIHLYRIAQEAAGNAIRHGHARQVSIALAATKENLLLTVTDDGTGLPPDARQRPGMGLRIMDYRAKLIGARFDLQNLPAGGARAVCVVTTRRKDHES